MSLIASVPSSLRGLVRSSLIAAVLPLMVGCGAAESADEGVDSRDDALNPRYGVDYAWARPAPSHLKAEGYTFAARYLSYDTTGKNLSKTEANELKAAGIDVVANWEWGADDALDGYARGVEHAKAAEAQATAAGMPAGRPMYFSVDFDATPGQQAAINAYMDGVASVIGRSRTGAYGGYYVIKRLFDAGKITWGWQTYAWSGGQWDPRAQVRQVQNGIEGGQLDKDEAVATDFGQWGASGGGNPPPAPPPSSDCSVHSDGRLHCDNTDNAAMHSATNAESSVVNHLRTTYSWFDCWATGELHAGGNHTWYHTLGDDNGNWGYVPAVDLHTSSSFDANPSAHGLKQCSTPKPLPANCDMHSDGKLHCVNSAHAAMYKSTNFSSGVVNHLETTNSWFKCWGTGALHAGGNHTWYYTLGDDNGNWGWVPAVDLDTPSSFDANPNVYGLPHCN
jgi:hypothetical protein